MIVTRAASFDDYPAVREILLDAFRSDDEARLWDYLLAHDRAVRPEHVRLAFCADEAVACTIVVPRTVSVPGKSVPGAVVTLVGCKRSYQRRGFGGASVKDALAHMKQSGHAIGVLWGIPEYYPRFGFVAVMQQTRTTIAVPDTNYAEPHFEDVSEKDCEWVAELFRTQLAHHSCTTHRVADLWAWQPRNPAQIRVLAARDGSGYAVVQVTENDTLMVREALWAPNEQELWPHALFGLARAEGKSRIVLRMQPGMPATDALLKLGGSLTVDAPSAGMAAILDWDAVLPAGFSKGPEGLDFEGRACVIADTKAITQIVLGFLSIDDALTNKTALLASGADPAHLRTLFVRRYPKLFEEPFWS